MSLKEFILIKSDNFNVNKAQKTLKNRISLKIEMSIETVTKKSAMNMFDSIIAMYLGILLYMCRNHIIQPLLILEVYK